ncbi:hypothetical protein FRB94_007992 [Tulasnella sp. JGI-2019a]|nr:hypothetical protein FRB94_007992 [Tulasnella sp. JGI-2019a]
MDTTECILPSPALEEASSTHEASNLSGLQGSVTLEAEAATLQPILPTSKDTANSSKATSVVIDAQKTPNLGCEESTRESIAPAPIEQNNIPGPPNLSSAIPRVFSNTGNMPRVVTFDNMSRFGDKDDYWTNYDKLTKKYDEDTMGRLNSNLENVLIFAGLFSGVNSAFIILVLSGFIPNPTVDTNTILSETNALLRLLIPNGDTITLPQVVRSSAASPSASAVRQLCIFFASLSISLAAAFGAVLAKQWLQFYEHTGKLVRADIKGQSRTERYYGAESWGLRVVVEALPTLLLISLALFFGALVDYLWTINKPAAVIVTAFAATMALFYCLTVVMAAIFPRCPFQTGPSVGLRHLCQRASRLLGRNTTFIIIATSRSNPRWRSAISEVKENGLILGVQGFAREVWGSIRRIGVSNRRFVFSISNLGWQIRYAIWWFQLSTESSAQRLQESCRMHSIALIESLISIDYFDLFVTAAAVIPLTLEMWVREGYRRLGETDRDITHAQSALWIMETAQDQEHLLVVAKNIISLDKWEAIWILRESQEFPKLLYGLHASLFELQQAHESEVKSGTVPQATSSPIVQAVRQDSGDSVRACLKTALSFARAVAHIILTDTDPQCWLSEVRQALVDPMDLKWEDPGQIRNSNLSQFTAITFIRHCILSQRLPDIIRYADSRIAGNEESDSELEWAIQILDLGQPELSGALLSMVSLAMISALRSPDVIRRWRTRRWKTKETAQWAWLTRSGVSEDVLDNVLDALSAYHEYFESLRNGDSHASPWLLACHTRFLMHLNRLILSPQRALVYEHERHVGTAKLLKRLLTNTLSVDGRSLGWKEEMVTALHKCKKQLYLTWILAKRELRRYEYAGGASDTRLSKKALPLEADKALGPLLDLYLAVEDGPSSLQRWIDSRPEAQHVAALSLALKTEPEIILDTVNELTLRLLFVDSTDDHRSSLPVIPRRNAPVASEMLNDAHLGIALTRVLSYQVMAGVPLDKFDWWPIVWLLEDARRCSVANKPLHIEETDVRKLFHMVTEMLRYSWRATRRKLMVAWFVETWASSLKPGAAASSWTSDETIRDFSSNVTYFNPYSLDRKVTVIETSAYDNNDTFVWEVDINHGHTSHFIEHIVQDNPQAAVTYDLDRTCEDLLQLTASRRFLGRTVAGSEEAQESEEAAVQRARDALEHLEQFNERSSRWSYTCRTCNRAVMADRSDSPGIYSFEQIRGVVRGSLRGELPEI